MKSERRTSRSGRPEEAVQLFLDAAKDRLSVRALTVGTRDGRLLFGAGEDLERIAMAGAEIDNQRAADDSIATWRTMLGDSSIVMASWGGRLPADLADGVKRILIKRPANDVA